jgi:3-oxoacyl-[acyl-carrier-protein] synthase II
VLQNIVYGGFKMEKRVVVTGMGAVTPIGNSICELWDGIKNGRNGINYLTRFNTDKFKVKVAAEVKDFNCEKYIDKRLTKRLDLFSIYAIHAASEAIENSQIDLEQVDKDRFGVYVGTGIGGISTIEEQVSKLSTKGPSRVSPMFIPMSISNMAAGNIAIKFGARGSCQSIVTACASGTSAIGTAFRNIKYGFSDICIAGGTDASITEIAVAGFTSITALSESTDLNKASIPFDKERTGFVIGEGAGIILLESYEHAKRRNAKIYAELVGYGETCDAYHITSPMPEGDCASNAIKLALLEAKVNPNEIDYINAHGTGTVANDSMETKAIKTAFGEHAKHVNISSTKSMTGHLLGAAGAMEAIICVKAIENDFVPATINHNCSDEGADLKFTPKKGIDAKINYAISNSLGFGGHNAVLCIKKWVE